MDLSEKIKELPQKSGVYIYKDDTGKIIYVGKAVKLKNRVKSYFQENRPKDAKTKALVKKISDLEYILTSTEAEALILEDTLIKKNKPRYNVLLKDDKTYPYVRVTNEPYPRLFYTRTKIKDGSKYYGPITEVHNLKNVMKLIRNLFHLRSCDLLITEQTIAEKKHKVCLDYHINKCDGPCEGLISQEAYNENIKRALKIIEGKSSEVEKSLEKEMVKAAENLEFEKAASYRNKIKLLMEFTSKQKIVSNDFKDRDVFGISRIDSEACSIVMKIRDGKLLGKRNYILKDALKTDDEELLQKTIEQWYLESDYVPKEIYLPSEPQDIEYLQNWLNNLKGSKVHLIIPKMGDRKNLVELAETNARYVLREYQLAHTKREQIIPRSVLSLQRDLNLNEPPRIIECFDNSHIQGSELVSSMVQFVDGKPNKNGYRKFKNKTVQSNNDFAAMEEAVKRRYTRLKEEVNNSTEEKPVKYPDLIIIDGGKGQLSSAKKILNDLGLNHLNVIGLAKRLEEVFFPGNSEPILLPKASSALRLLQHARDEAHRFAITYHRSLRDKRTLQTELTRIPGIGEKTAKKLLKELGSVEKVRNADEETLKNHLNAKQAKAVLEYFE